MKTAYLIICHKDAQHVSRLVHRIHSENSHVFVHVDKNASNEFYNDLCARISDLKYCKVLEERKHGVLDDRSLVDISMMLVACAKKTAQQNGFQYSYYVNMSGQDYPIRSMSFVEETLEKNYPDLYLDCKEGVAGHWVERKFERNKSLILYRNWVLKCKNDMVKKALQGLGVLLRKILKIFGQTTLQRIRKRGWKCYGGSAWWILPDCVIDAIEKEYNEKTEFASIMLDESVTPEETFFQSMAMHLFYPEGVDKNHTDMKVQEFKTYVDFGFMSGRPVVCHPYVITMEAYDRLCTEDYWFARKFDSSVDAEILDKIDETLLDSNSSI